MTTYAQMTKEELSAELDALQAAYDEFKAKGLALNMARGKPGADQLDLSMPMLNILEPEDLTQGTDLRNYGILDGIPVLQAS